MACGDSSDSTNASCHWMRWPDIPVAVNCYVSLSCVHLAARCEITDWVRAKKAFLQNLFYFCNFYYLSVCMLCRWVNWLSGQCLVWADSWSVMLSAQALDWPFSDHSVSQYVTSSISSLSHYVPFSFSVGLLTYLLHGAESFLRS